MRRLLGLITVLAWGLWFGGMITLFLFVSYLFVSDRESAVVTAPKLFFVFERYQMIVAAIALLASAIWRITTPRASITTLFTLFALSAIGVVFSATLIRPPLEKLRAEGRSSGDEFHRLHKLSEYVYETQAALMLIAGIILPTALNSASPKTTPETDPPSTPRA